MSVIIAATTTDIFRFLLPKTTARGKSQHRRMSSRKNVAAHKKLSVRSVVNVDVVFTVNQAGYIYLYMRINFHITASGRMRRVTVWDGDDAI